MSDAHERMLGGAGHIVVDRFFLGELKRFVNNDEYVAIGHVLGDADMRERLERCDAVVVNGEGPCIMAMAPSISRYSALPKSWVKLRSS